MLANYHTHSVFCDGQNTLEEIVKSAIARGFDAIGFSSHGYTPYDERYCMKDTAGYIREARALQAAYRDKIEICLGVEEDAFAPVDRSSFDYIIGSSHYLRVGGDYLAIDSSREHFERCLDAFGGDVLRLAESYYSAFCTYIHTRRPDVIGHFDLITKYDELQDSLFLENAAYRALAERYVSLAADAECIFEINTGAIARGLRRTPYPSENLLYVLRKKGARILLSSDSHAKDTLDFAFDETKARLREIGFLEITTLKAGKFVNIPL